MRLPQSSLFKNSVWNLAGYTYLLLASLFSLPYLLQGLGADGYARYLIVTAFCAVMASLDLGFPTSLLRSLSSQSGLPVIKSLRSGLFGALTVAALAALFASLLLDLLTATSLWQVDPTSTAGLGLPLLLLVFVTHLLSVTCAVPQSQNDFGIASVRAFIAGTGNTLFSAAVAAATHNLAIVLWVQVASSALALLLLLLYTASRFGGRALLPFYSAHSLRTHLKYGLPVFFGNLAPQLQGAAARLIGALFLPAAALASIGVSQSLVVRGSGIFGQITSASFPAYASLASGRAYARLRQLVTHTSLLFLTLSALAFALIYFVGQPLLSWWLHDSVLASAVLPVLVIYLVYSLVLSLTPAPSTALTASGRTGIPALTAWLHFLLELPLLFFLLPRLGASGAPTAALAAVSVPTLILLYQAWRRLR